jgi:hypothetical protein
MKKILLNTTLMGGICCALAAVVPAQALYAQTVPTQPVPAQKQVQSPRPVGSTPSSVTYYGNNSYLNAEEDSSVSPVQTVITYKKNGPLYHIRMTDDKVIELSVDGRKIPADSFYVYDALTKKLALQIKADKAEAKLDKEQAEKDGLQANQDREQAAKDELQSKEDRVQAEKDRLLEKLDAEQSARDKVEAEIEEVQARMEKVEAENEKEMALAEAREMEEDRKQAVKDRIQAVEDRNQANRDRIQAAEDRAILKKLISEIIKEGLVPDEKSLHSLSLDKDDFFINGKQQSDTLQKKFREKFNIKADTNISYHKD